MNINIINKSNNPLPKHETLGSAGLDLMANLPTGLNGNSSIIADELFAKLKGEGFIVTARHRPDDNINDIVITVAPKGRVLIPSGIFIAIPKGYKGDVLPRSGLALKKGITLGNSPGLIDEDYRGELGVY